MRADGYWGFFAAYGEAADSVRTCVLKVPTGTVELDPSYLVDMRQLTGRTINDPWFHVQRSPYLAQVWDASQPIPGDPGTYWYADMNPLLVDVERGTAAPYPVIDGSIELQRRISIDGVSYYELNPRRYVVGGRSDIVELRPEGIVRKFSVPGLGAFARIR